MLDENGRPTFTPVSITDTGAWEWLTDRPEPM